MNRIGRNIRTRRNNIIQCGLSSSSGCDVLKLATNTELKYQSTLF